MNSFGEFEDEDMGAFNKQLNEAVGKVKRQKKDAVVLNKAIEEKKEELNIESTEELAKILPRADYKEHGAVEVINVYDIALTVDKNLTRTKYFTSLDVKKDLYPDLTFTPQEAASLNAFYGRMVWGINSVVALKCRGNECPFAKECPYVQMDKAPLGKPCLIEVDLLAYHTKKFMEEFEVDPNSHSELMLVQELSELMIYEMRVTRFLAEDVEASTLSFEEILTTPEGNEISTKVEHWAWGTKEKIKNRRMKILDSLMALRKSKGSPDKDGDRPQQDYKTFVSGIMQKIDDIVNKSKIEDAEIIEKKES